MHGRGESRETWEEFGRTLSADKPLLKTNKPPADLRTTLTSMLSGRTARPVGGSGFPAVGNGAFDSAETKDFGRGELLTRRYAGVQRVSVTKSRLSMPLGPSRTHPDDFAGHTSGSASHADNINLLSGLQIGFGTHPHSQEGKINDRRRLRRLLSSAADAQKDRDLCACSLEISDRFGFCPHPEAPGPIMSMNSLYFSVE